MIRQLLCGIGIHIYKRVEDKHLIGKRVCRGCGKKQTAYSVIGKHGKICGWNDEE